MQTDIEQPLVCSWKLDVNEIGFYRTRPVATITPPSTTGRDGH